MASSVLEVTETKTTVSILETVVQVSVEETNSSILLGSSGPQGPKGDLDTAAINAHIANATPHPAYDDTPSLSLVFENGLV